MLFSMDVPPRRGGANPKGGGCPNLLFGQSSRKLHENKESWDKRGEASPGLNSTWINRGSQLGKMFTIFCFT